MELEISTVAATTSGADDWVWIWESEGKICSFMRIVDGRVGFAHSAGEQGMHSDQPGPLPFIGMVDELKAKHSATTNAWLAYTLHELSKTANAKPGAEPRDAGGK